MQRPSLLVQSRRTVLHVTTHPGDVYYPLSPAHHHASKSASHADRAGILPSSKFALSQQQNASFYPSLCPVSFVTLSPDGSQLVRLMYDDLTERCLARHPRLTLFVCHRVHYLAEVCPQWQALLTMMHAHCSSCLNPVVFLMQLMEMQLVALLKRQHR